MRSTEGWPKGRLYRNFYPTGQRASELRPWSRDESRWTNAVGSVCVLHVRRSVSRRARRIRCGRASLRAAAARGRRKKKKIKIAQPSKHLPGASCVAVWPIAKSFSGLCQTPEILLRCGPRHNSNDSKFCPAAMNEKPMEQEAFPVIRED